MKKILLVSELASLGRDFERYHTMNAGGNARELPSLLGHNQNKFGTLFEDVEDESSMGGMTPISRMDTGDEDIHIDRIVDPNDRSPLTGMLSQAQKSRIDKLLGMWEEPTIKESSVVSVLEPCNANFN